MKFVETPLEGCFIVEPNVFADNRGYFMESYNQSAFSDYIGHDINFIQDNQSYSTRGVLRGLHYQTGSHAQSKLVRVMAGSVLDIAVDIRPASQTYGQYFSIVLSDTQMNQLFIPRGFAHGFLVLSEYAIFFYKCDNFYNKESEGGIIYSDRDLDINWQLPPSELIISDKDLMQPSFLNAKKAW